MNPDEKDLQCSVCSVQPPKYKCPRCSTRTCSAACVREHKSATGCSGERNKTAYVPLEHYTENHLFSDYTLLEDTARSADTAARQRRRGDAAAGSGGRMATMTPRQRSLMAAAGRGRVRLRFMARGMSRADRNQSSADPVNRGGAIAWTVDLHLPFLIDSNAALSPVTLHGIPDSAPLDRMVAAILDPAHPLALAHPALHVALSAHSSALLVPADPEQSESSSPYWYLRRPLPPSGQDARRLHVPLGDGATTTLAAALAGLPVYEYPALVLTLLPLDPTDMVLPRAIGDDDADEPSAAAARNGGGDDEDDEEEEGEVSEHALPPPTLTSLPRPPAATRVSARPSMQQHQQQQHHQHHQQRRSTSSVSYQDLNNIWAKLGQSLGADAEGQVQAAFAADLEDEDEDEDDS